MKTTGSRNETVVRKSGISCVIAVSIILEPLVYYCIWFPRIDAAESDDGKLVFDKKNLYR